MKVIFSGPLLVLVIRSVSRIELASEDLVWNGRKSSNIIKIELCLYGMFEIRSPPLNFAYRKKQVRSTFRGVE